MLYKSVFGRIGIIEYDKQNLVLLRYINVYRTYFRFASCQLNIVPKYTDNILEWQSLSGIDRAIFFSSMIEWTMVLGIIYLFLHRLGHKYCCLSQEYLHRTFSSSWLILLTPHKDMKQGLIRRSIEKDPSLTCDKLLQIYNFRQLLSLGTHCNSKICSDQLPS